MSNIKDKIAIIGFGASGFGTYLGLIEKGFKNIYIYDHKPLRKNIEIDQWNNKNLKKNYRILKDKLGFSTTNSKTYFGNDLKSIIAGNYKIYDNQIGGGLLNFWGGVLQKFDYKTLKLCLGIDNLDDYYTKISKNILISQIVHKSSKQNIYSNQENIDCNKYVEEIVNSISKNSLEIIEKDTILAMSQNIEHKNCNCFIGCLKHNIFKTNNLDLTKSIKIINENVKKIDFDKKAVISDNSSQTFDKIYLNTGPYNDQKILLSSSENSQESIKVKDSTSFTFPIFYKGELKKDKVDFALTNCVFSVKDGDNILGHAQVYPPIDHINKSIIPNFLWNRFNLIKDLSLNRLLWVRCYLNDEYSQIKEFNNNKTENINQLKIKNVQKKFFKVFKKNFKNKNFSLINFFINSKTSSHYAGDSDHVRKNILKQTDNHYKKSIFFNDSLLWDNLPSQSPTFTIMANALRNTDLYL